MGSLPLVEELAAAPDPIEAAARLSGLPFLALMHSSAPHSVLSRYSYLSADPVHLFYSRHGQTTRSVPLRSESSPLASSLLQAVHDQLAPFVQEPVPGLPPFQGGAIGFVGYEYGRTLERIPAAYFDDLELPEAVIGVYDWVMAWDHEESRAWIVSTGLPGVGAERLRRSQERLRLVRSALESRRGEHRVSREPRPRTRLAPTFPVEGREGIRSTFTAERYRAAVGEVVRYILAGDVFQVNLSQRFEAPWRADPLELYGRLAAITPAPFGGYFDFGEAALVSASPERFLHYDPVTRLVETRPIKGTRPRGTTALEDERLRSELLSSPKDRAENVMIVDLLRNDLSRVCQPGSVQVPALLTLESHPTVHHLVSTVTGRLQPGATVADLLHAAFPGGSITGAPKIRAMEIIAELEPTVRGPYTGTLGYWSLTGAMDTNIMIRSFVLSEGRAVFHAGGGIVADSDPGAEYRETLDKAAALIRAVSQ